MREVFFVESEYGVEKRKRLRFFTKHVLSETAEKPLFVRLKMTSSNHRAMQANRVKTSRAA